MVMMGWDKLWILVLPLLPRPRNQIKSASEVLGFRAETKKCKTFSNFARVRARGGKSSITHDCPGNKLNQFHVPLAALGGDVTAEGMFIGMAKQASDALDGAMEGIASEHEMVNIRHGQLAKGGEAHVATLNCAALVAELGEEHAGQDGVQTLRHVEGGGASQLVFRPAGLALLRALAPRGGRAGRE